MFRPEFIVLASDGVWEVASNEAVAKWVGDYLDANAASSNSPGNQPAAGAVNPHSQAQSPTRQSLRHAGALMPQIPQLAEEPRARHPTASGSGGGGDARARITAAQEVVVQVLANVAGVHRMSVGAVHRLRPGQERRKYHDDITATVVVFRDRPTTQ